jgi:hypothetical protein
MCVLFTKCFKRDQTKGDEMRGVCTTSGSDEECI